MESSNYEETSEDELKELSIILYAQRKCKKGNQISVYVKSASIIYTRYVYTIRWPLKNYAQSLLLKFRIIVRIQRSKNLLLSSFCYGLLHCLHRECRTKVCFRFVRGSQIISKTSRKIIYISSRLLSL